MTKRSWLVTTPAALLVAGTLAATAAAGDGSEPAGERRRGKWMRKLSVLRERARGEAQKRRARFLQFVGSLELTNDQKLLVLEKANAARAIADGARKEAAKILVEAWDAAKAEGGREAARAAAKEKLRDLRKRTRDQIAPLAKEVVQSLAPEQRKKIEDAAAKRGRKVDDERLTRLAAFLLTRPMTVPLIEARLGR